MVVIKKCNIKKGISVEVFKSKIGRKNVYFVSKITPKKIRTGQARNKSHALRWAKNLCKTNESGGYPSDAFPSQTDGMSL